MKIHRVRLDMSKKNKEVLAHYVHSTPQNRITKMDSKDSGIKVGNKKTCQITFQLFSFQNSSQNMRLW